MSRGKVEIDLDTNRVAFLQGVLTRIPIPSGSYEVTIHFCRTTVFPECPEKRTVDVFIEEEQVLGGYEIGERGLGVPEPKGPFRVDVNDGILDVVFRLRWRCHVSALEVRRM